MKLKYKVTNPIDKLVIPFVFLVLSAILVHLYIKHENFIYYWDYSNYYNKYLYFGNIIKNNGIFNQILLSIKTDDYNLLATIPLVILKPLFGASRFGFILSILVAYAFPSVLILTNIFKKDVFTLRQNFFNNTAALFVILLTIPPLFWGPILRGYVDVVVVIPACALLLIAFKEIYGKGTILDFVWMGVFLFLGPLLRRWFLIWSVSYLAALAIVLLIQGLATKQKIGKKLFDIFLKLMLASLVFIFLTYLIKPLFITGLSSSFLSQFSAYKTSASFTTKILDQVKWIGLIYLPLFCIGLISSLTKKKSKYFGIFLLLVLVFSVSLFIKIQDFYDHYSYLYLPIFIFFTATGYYEIYYSKYKELKYCVLFTFTILVLTSYLSVFTINFSINKRVLGLPVLDYYPLVRTDLSTVDKMINFLNSLIRTSNDKVYVLSSSFTLNDSIVQNRADELGYILLSNNILGTQEVDKRDGFPYNFFSAKYILTTQPVGYHLDPNEQKSIGILHDFLINNNKYFNKLTGCYYLDGEICAEIYDKKIIPPSVDIKILENDFKNIP